MATDMKRIVSPDSWGLGWGRAVTALPQLALPAPLSVAPSQPRSPSLDPLDPSALEGVAGVQGSSLRHSLSLSLPGQCWAYGLIGAGRMGGGCGVSPGAICLVMRCYPWQGASSRKPPVLILTPSGCSVSRRSLLGLLRGALQGP